MSLQSFIIITLYISTIFCAKPDKIKLKHNKEKEVELVDKFLNFVNATWDYLMQIMYYKAAWMGLDSENSNNSISGSEEMWKMKNLYTIAKDIFLAFTDVMLNTKKKKKKQETTRTENLNSHNVIIYWPDY